MAPVDDAQSAFFSRELQPLVPSLRRWLRRRYPLLSDVDDVVQVSLLKTLGAWRQERLTAPKAFLWRVAINASLSFFRQRRMFDEMPVIENPALRVLADDADTFETVCSRDELVAVADAVSRLPDRCRQIVTLRLLQGVDYATIAERMDLSEDTVRVQVARGVKKCLEHLRARGVLAETKP